jgi:hypothetical protein
MKSAIINSTRRSIFVVLFSAIFIMVSTVSHGQKIEEISISAYPGFTLVNFEQALGYSDNDMEDWSQFHISASLRGFLSSAKPVRFGTELAWQQLYYAYYIVPYGPSPVYREFNVTTFSVTVLGRYSVNNFFLTGGAGIHFFNSGVSPAICLEVGYMLGNSDKLRFPVSFRINPIFGSGTPVPISIGAGVSFKL